MAIEWTIDQKKVFCATGGKPFDSKTRAVILLHGAGMDHSCWSLQSRWFAWHGWSVLVPDLPGHRGSEGAPLPTVSAMVEWVERLMNQAELQSAALVGHSMGAIVALQMAANLPERVAQLGLLGVADTMSVHPELLEAAQKNDPLAYDLITSWGHGSRAHFGQNPSPGIWMLGNGRQLLARNRSGVLFNDLKACNEWKAGLQTAAEVKCRSLVIIGENDQMTPPHKGKRVAETLPNSQAVILHDCGHMMMQEQPDGTLDALIAEFQH